MESKENFASPEALSALKLCVAVREEHELFSVVVPIVFGNRKQSVSQVSWECWRKPAEHTEALRACLGKMEQSLCPGGVCGYRVRPAKAAQGCFLWCLSHKGGKSRPSESSPAWSLLYLEAEAIFVGTLRAVVKRAQSLPSWWPDGDASRT